MPRPQEWFELRDIRALDRAAWVPLRVSQVVSRAGRHGEVGYEEEFYGIGTIAVPVAEKSEAEKLGWMDVGLSHSSRPGAYSDVYIPSDTREVSGRKSFGVFLALEQSFDGAEQAVWHLHQDFVIALGLLREGDVWRRPEEDYLDVARLTRTAEGVPCRLEVRAEQLVDYLAARNMGLFVTQYRSRVEVVEDPGHIDWGKDVSRVKEAESLWERRITPIHEGGHGFGDEMAVFHVVRTDPIEGDDVPILDQPTDENTESKSWTVRDSRRKVYRIHGELWRSEWIAPAVKSRRVRRDEVPSNVEFIVDQHGARESGESLTKHGRWLWFRPEVVQTLVSRRGGSLEWYTRDTGSVAGSPACGVHFGLNALGLLNVYAKDIGLLPEWLQRVWAGFNVTPDGGVSPELLASQVKAQPAATSAVETDFVAALDDLNNLFRSLTGQPLFRDHDEYRGILRSAHRFRAINDSGLFSLAKDLARLTVDSLNVSALQKLVAPPKGETSRSIKSLERVLASVTSEAVARVSTAPFVGVYELRHGDAHLPSSEIEQYFRFLRVDRSAPHVRQGQMMLEGLMSGLAATYRILKENHDALGGGRSSTM